MCVDITSRLFGCVCQSVTTELNTGIYPAITALSGQALCGYWMCGTDRECVCAQRGMMHHIHNSCVGVHIHAMISASIISFYTLPY